jgi:hypothetical protein
MRSLSASRAECGVAIVILAMAGPIEQDEAAAMLMSVLSRRSGAPGQRQR